MGVLARVAAAAMKCLVLVVVCGVTEIVVFRGFRGTMHELLLGFLGTTAHVLEKLATPGRLLPM